MVNNRQYLSRKSDGFICLDAEGGVAMSNGTPVPKGTETCGVELDDGTTCENVAGDDGTCHIDSHTRAVGDESGTPTVPRTREWYKTHADTLALSMGVSESWEGATIEETVARMLIRKDADDRDDKVTLYRSVFGTCEVCEEQGTNGWSDVTCAECDEPTDGSGESGGDVSLSDLSESDREALVNQVVEQLGGS